MSTNIREELKDFARDHRIPILKEDAQSVLLRMVKEEGKKKILELGTAIAYTSIALAQSDASICVDTIEKEEALYQRALRNVRQASLEERVRCYGMDIDDFTPSGKYDVIFVDAAKAQYEKYFFRFAPYLKENGFFFFDNMVFHGMIYRVEELRNRSTRSLVKKIIHFREKIRLLDDYNATFYDNIGDGILIVRRRHTHEG